MRVTLIIVGILLVLCIAGGALWFLLGGRIPTPITVGNQESPYHFDDAGIAFDYPRNYTFESYPLEDETESWSSLMLVRTAEKEAAEANGASEGPVAIVIGIFPNSGNISLEDWIKNNSHSNFHLSADQKLDSVTIGGMPGLAYTHSGLFENDTVAVAHSGSIYLFEVSWADASDTIRADFQNLLKTVQFK
jgi:hypothetical protein